MSDSMTPPGDPGSGGAAEQPSAAPEYLDSHDGGPIDAEPSAPRRSRRPLLIAGGALAAVAVGGAAAWAAMWYFSSGPDAAEALPSSTLAYVSVNLDPSGEEKIDAVNTLKKFPGLKDKLNFDSKDDVRKQIFEQMQQDGSCSELDYAKDIEPWLGDRIAVAAVDAGEPDPSPIVVFQVTDQDKARAGVAGLADCGGPGGDKSWFALEDGWAIVAPTTEIADKVVAEAKSSSLADDGGYQKALDEAGDSGIVTMYAAPAAGEWFSTFIADQTSASPLGTQFPSESLDQLKNFKGMAGVMRFHDGGLEFEFSGDFSGMTNGIDLSSAGKADVVSTLPDDTALAIGLSLPAGWLTAFADAIAPSVSPGQTGEELIAQAEQATGLNLPEDFEALTGQSIALAVSSDIDLESMINSGDPSSLPIGIKVKGDASKANEVLDKLRAQMGPEASLLASKDADGYFVVGPSQSYLDTLLANGHLGDNNMFKDVVPNAESSMEVVYLDFDAGNNWLVEALKSAGAPAEVTDNVEPLSAFGITAWMDGDVSHGMVKITTD